MELQTELSLFAKSTTLLYSRPTKVPLEEELHQLTSILNTLTSSIGLKLGNLKETSTGNLLTYISVLSLAISLCDNLKREIKKHAKSGVNLSKSAKPLANHISFLKATRTKLTQRLTKRMD